MSLKAELLVKDKYSIIFMSKIQHYNVPMKWTQNVLTNQEQITLIFTSQINRFGEVRFYKMLVIF